MEKIEEQRIHFLNDHDFREGNYVLYWMHLSQRVQYNHSLIYASDLANKLDLPLLVFFGITASYPDANLRHFRFMLEGLVETSETLKKKNIKMIIRLIDPVYGAVTLADDAAAVVTDFGYLKMSREWLFRAAESIKTKFIAVESNIIVPVKSASVKEEYTAATFRPKIMKLVNLYLNKVNDVKITRSSLDLKINGIDLDSILSVTDAMNIDKSVAPAELIHGGTSNAVKLLNNFIKNKLDDYPEKRNHPSLDYGSGMSPYLHFGQISPVFLAKKILATESPGRDVFLEELIVRRELGFNFVYYNENYDKINSLPGWALQSLLKHESDQRDFIYSKNEFEQGMTHDKYWNSAQHELAFTGKMHNYMRMYWGKKIIEWTKTPEIAFEYMVYLNNKYALDGRDPNSYAGIAWCLGKHDRPWMERSIFGKIRYMNDKGLERKFDMNLYLKKYER